MNKSAADAGDEGRVYVRDRDPETFAVSEFGGWADPKDVATHLRDLRRMLKRDHVAFDSREFVESQFSSPFRLLLRHNEVWIPVLNSAS